MNGTTVYMISIGRLYRTCGGSSSVRLRWKMHAHRIRPQTTAPTASAAIHDPCHRVSITFPCLVTGAGLLRSGGTPVPRGWAGRRRRLLIALRREPFRLFRVAAVRLIANSRTQPLLRTLRRVRICPPASRWFRFNSVSEALLWGAHFPRRRSPGLGHMWLYFHPRRVRVCRMSPAGLDDGTRGHAEGAKGPGGS